MGIGDELLISGRARVMQQTDPRKVRPTFRGKARWDAVWDNNPRIAGVNEKGDFQELVARNGLGLRPYHTAKTAERWVYNPDFRPDVGELYFSAEERAFGARYAGRLIIEPNIKPGASPNKQWGLDRWQRLARMLIGVGMPVTQLGVPGTAVLRGAELVQTSTFRLAAAVLAGARGFVSGEGGLHHAAAALGIPGVVIFGGFTPVELTGYPIHRNLGVGLSDACGMRVPCSHCEQIMASIRPGQVFDELRGLLK